MSDSYGSLRFDGPSVVWVQTAYSDDGAELDHREVPISPFEIPRAVEEFVIWLDHAAANRAASLTRARDASRTAVQRIIDDLEFARTSYDIHILKDYLRIASDIHAHLGRLALAHPTHEVA